MINYKHLHYFWIVAKEGSIARACERLHLTPQTVSGQLSLLEEHLGEPLFNRVGRSLELTEIGRQVQAYAGEIFSLGSELEEMVRNFPSSRPLVFKVGVADVVPDRLPIACWCRPSRCVLAATLNGRACRSGMRRTVTRPAMDSRAGRWISCWVRRSRITSP